MSSPYHRAQQTIAPFAERARLAIELDGPERARLVADLTEYEWQTDPTRNPFAKYLNQGASMYAKLAP